MEAHIARVLLLISFSSFFFVPGTAQAKSPTIGLTNLTNNSSAKSAPSIALSSSGDLVVAWEQQVPRGRKIDWDVFVDVAPGGVFLGPANFSNDISSARSPYLFQSQNGVYMLYRDTLAGASNFKVMGAEWNGSAWSSPLRVDNANFQDAQDPVGVQLPNGTIWFTWQAWAGWTWTDTVAQTIGGNLVNVSNDGSAVKHPAITYGDGNLYIAWVDHANERVRRMSPGIHVAKYDGTSWTQLPVPTIEYSATFPSLAYANHNLYLVWRSSAPMSVKSAVWDGSAWGARTMVDTGNGIMSATVFAPSSGNIFIAWENAGKIYLQKDQDAPIFVSAGVPNAHQPSLFVDSTDTAFLAFRTKDIWYARVTP